MTRCPEQSVILKKNKKNKQTEAEVSSTMCSPHRVCLDGRLISAPILRHRHIYLCLLVFIPSQGCGKPRYEVRNRLLHILFLLSAGMGHEIFYITWLPNIHWSLDPFLCRRLVNMWTVSRGLGGSGARLCVNVRSSSAARRLEAVWADNAGPLLSVSFTSPFNLLSSSPTPVQ